jgi:N-acetylglucosaminylphosphatidylinositol deacetylase
MKVNEMWLSQSRKSYNLRKSSKVLLVIAHPDDEAMFFSPLLLDTNAASSISLLCLSTGDFDGLGSCRRVELLKSADCYNINRNRVHIIDHPALKGIRLPIPYINFLV